MRNWINLIERVDPMMLPAFKAWFGDSKIVDETGHPLVVYHGGTSWRIAPGITWFTDDPAVADGYADQGYDQHAEIKACYLRIERPLDLRDRKTIEMVFPDGLDTSSLRRI